jgi:hypothetical protein
MPLISLLPYNIVDNAPPNDRLNRVDANRIDVTNMKLDDEVYAWLGISDIPGDFTRRFLYSHTGSTGTGTIFPLIYSDTVATPPGCPGCTVNLNNSNWDGVRTQGSGGTHTVFLENRDTGATTLDPSISVTDGVIRGIEIKRTGTTLTLDLFSDTSFDIGSLIDSLSLPVIARTWKTSNVTTSFDGNVPGATNIASGTFRNLEEPPFVAGRRRKILLRSE